MKINEQKQQKWATILQEAEASGQTNKEFCAGKDFDVSTFYYWKKKLRSQPEPGAFKELKVSNQETAVQEVKQPTPAVICELEISGKTVRVFSGAPFSLIKKLLKC